MPARIEIDGFRDRSLSAPISISMTEKELLVLNGPAGSWMGRLASLLAGLGPGRSARISADGDRSAKAFVLLRPPFLDPDREVYQQLENRLTAFGPRRPTAKELVSGWCQAQGLAVEARRKASTLPEGLLVFLSLAVPCCTKPAALVAEDPLTGMPADLACRAVQILRGLSADLPVLVLCADPLRFEGVARIVAVPSTEALR